MHRLATKRTGKKRIKENAKVSFLRQTDWSCYVLLFTDFVNY